MLVLRILLGLALCLCILFLWSRRRFYKLMFQLNGPKGLPLIGVVYKFRCLEDLFNFAQNAKKEYGFPVFTWIGPFPTLILADPVTAQDILTSPHCVNKAKLYEPIVDVLGDGLITLANPEWSLHRKLLNPAFGPANLRSFVPIFNEKTKDFLKDFEVSYGGGPISILPAILRLTINMALQTTMGLKNFDDNNSFEETEERLFKYYHYFAEKMMAFIVMPWLRLDIVQKLLPSLRQYKINKRGLKAFFTNLIRKKLEILSATGAAAVAFTNKKDEDYDLEQKQVFNFVDMVIELLRSSKFTAKDVEDHSNHIVAGAFETTATTIAHVLILLAIHPKQQQIVFEELFALYDNRDEVTVTDEDLQRLVYLEMVINETMRLIPTVPIVGRTPSTDVKLSSGVVLPPGIQVIISLFHLHRNESIWGQNASVFNPENFLPENLRDKHPYAFIPFTKGIRTCIGNRYGMIATKVALAILLRKYRFTATGKFDEFRYATGISMRLVNPPLVTFHLREK